MDLIRDLEKLFLKGGFELPTCRCGAEKVATEMCLSADEEFIDVDAGRGLREISLEYAWSELNRATAGFSTAKVVGSGRAGTVFEGRLVEGVDVAVKVLDDPVGGSCALHEEIRLLSRCHHPNVVMLLGFCSDVKRNCQALVYELLPGGSVFSRLHTTQTRPFQWEDRVKAATHASRALAHLHKLRPEVFHRDVKSSVILFTAEGVAKLADFQFACTSKTRVHQYSSAARLVGTSGYMAPEYPLDGLATEASEVYSMGVVLLELLTGELPATAPADGCGHTTLVDMVQLEAEHANDRLLGMLDSRAQWPEETAAGVAAFALQCLHRAPERRPGFLEAVTVLQHVALIAVTTTSRANSPEAEAGPEACGGSQNGAGPAAAALMAGTEKASLLVHLPALPVAAAAPKPAAGEGETGMRPGGRAAQGSHRRTASTPPGMFESLMCEETSRLGSCRQSTASSAEPAPQVAAAGGAAEDPGEPAKLETEDRSMPNDEPASNIGTPSPAPPLAENVLGGVAGSTAAASGSSQEPSVARSHHLEPDLQAAGDALPAPLDETQAASTPESTAHPAPRGGEAEAETRGDGVNGRQWLRRWNWSRAAAQGDGQGEVGQADPPMNRWDLRDKAEAVISRLDLRVKLDPEAHGEPRRWLQGWMLPSTPGAQAAAQDAAKGKAEEISSGDEASSEDEGERPRWLKGWRRQQPTSGSTVTPALLAARRQASEEAGAEATKGRAAPVLTAATMGAGDLRCGPAEVANADGGAGLSESRSPDREAIGRLFHISDLVE